MKAHGTPNRYRHGLCRCAKCREAWAAHCREYFHGGSSVTAAEVVEWARGLGFTIHPSLKGRAATAIVGRWNREHPERPYVRRSA